MKVKGKTRVVLEARNPYSVSTYVVTVPCYSLDSEWNHGYDGFDLYGDEDPYWYFEVEASNVYDHLDRRVQKITPEATHSFFYDAWMLVKEVIANTTMVQQVTSSITGATTSPARASFLNRRASCPPWLEGRRKLWNYGIVEIWKCENVKMVSLNCGKVIHSPAHFSA